MNNSIETCGIDNISFVEKAFSECPGLMIAVIIIVPIVKHLADKACEAYKYKIAVDKGLISAKVIAVPEMEYSVNTEEA